MDNYIARYNKRQQCIRGKKDHNVGLRIEKHKYYLKSALMFFLMWINFLRLFMEKLYHKIYIYFILGLMIILLL